MILATQKLLKRYPFCHIPIEGDASFVLIDVVQTFVEFKATFMNN